MSVYAIICEYDPFHAGHAWQIAEIRRRDPAAVVLCVMSGSFTQRGTPALFSPFVRAERAVRGGADAVLLLPMPFSASSAERFAKAGAYVAAQCGAEVLAFGAECGNEEDLRRVAERLRSETFRRAMREAVRSSHDSVGYPRARAAVYASCFGEEDLSLLTGPNNMLALEYLHAADTLGLRTVVLPRIGAGHDEPGCTGAYASASAIRAALRRGEEPGGCFGEDAALYTALFTSGHASDAERAGAYLLGRLSFLPAQRIEQCADVPVGMGTRLSALADRCDTVEAFFRGAATKKYTDARIRRMVLAALLEIEKADAAALPRYTLLLAASRAGCRHLRGLSPSPAFTVLTKPAAARNMDAAAQAQFDIERRAERLYRLTVRDPLPTPGKPFIKTD